MGWSQVLLGLGLLVAAANSENADARCQAAGGECKFLSEGCEDGSFRIGFCGAPSSRRCCIKRPDNDDQCQAASGNCQMLSEGCSNGRFRIGLCSGGAERKCCVRDAPDDTPCTSLGGRCQRENSHCSGDFRLGLCRDTGYRCCVSTGGCDPDKDLFWHNLDADDDFNEDELLGTWYQTRWYVPTGVNITDMVWDSSVTFFRKSGNVDKLYAKINGRIKATDCCSAENEFALDRLSNGIYRTPFAFYTGKPLDSSFHYVTKSFMVELHCYTPSDTGCEDHGAYFWSKTKTSSPQEIARGEHIIKSHCYPYWKRFLTSLHEMDCVPPPSKPKCGKDGDDGDDGEMFCSNMCTKEDEDKMKRDCTPNINTFKTMIAAHNFDVKQLQGLWYFVRWYLPSRSFLGREQWDRSVLYHFKEEHPNVLFWDENSRPIGEYVCNEEITDNATRVRHGAYDLPVGSNRMVFTFVYITEEFHVEVGCTYGPNNKDGCDDVCAHFWSRTKVPNPEDVKKGEEIVNNLCFPDMKRFTIPKHEMDCDKQTHSYCKEDAACKKVKGECQYVKGGCRGGHWAKGKCGGPDDRSCCVPGEKKCPAEKYDDHDKHDYHDEHDDGHGYHHKHDHDDD